MPTLLVAAAGGHLHELVELVPRFAGASLGEITWVTFDTAQSRSVLAGADVVFAPYPHPRDLVVSIRHLALAHRIFAERRFSHVISTGSSVAVPFLWRGALAGSSCHYIESATRLDRPSLTGRILARSPRVQCYTQQAGWPDPPWLSRGSVFDGFAPRQSTAPSRPLRRLLVAAGSSSSYGFRRMIEEMVKIVPPDTEVLWQTGSTDVTGIAIDARPAVPEHELAEAARRADVVVTHAGVGLSLLALSSGRCPILVPRRRHLGEHVDDHQVEVASMLVSRGLALDGGDGRLSLALLERAARIVVERADRPPVFHLAP